MHFACHLAARLRACIQMAALNIAQTHNGSHHISVERQWNG